MARTGGRCATLQSATGEEPPSEFRGVDFASEGPSQGEFQAALAYHEGRVVGEVRALLSKQGRVLDSVAGRVDKLMNDVGEILKALQCSGDFMVTRASTRATATPMASMGSTYTEQPISHATSRADDLPVDWPERVLSRHDEYTAKRPGTRCQEAAKGAESAQNEVAAEYGKKNMIFEDELAQPPETPFVTKYLVLQPNSTKHMLFGLVGWVALTWDLTFIPYLLAWNVAWTGWLGVVALVVCCFWTMDLAMGFLTGFHLQGEPVMELSAIARHYIRTFLLPDFLTVLCDWVSIICAIIEIQGAGAVKTLRLLKMARMLRIFNMLRVLKFVRVYEDLMDQYFAESHRLMLRFFSLFLYVCWVSHIISCCWYAIGAHGESDTGARWTDSLFLSTEPWHQYTYTTAFLWSVSQITLGSTETVSHNSSEKLFSVLCLLIGLLLGSALISSLSATMVEFQVSRNQRHQNLRKLRRFLADNQINKYVALLVQKQVTERLDAKEHVTDQDVTALDLLSDSVRKKLCCSYFQPHVLQHPLFRFFDDLSTRLIQHVCFRCLKMSYMRPMDDLFAPGPAKASMYLLIKGDLIYHQDPTSSRMDHVRREAVEPGQWIAEPALWSVWTHVGALHAATWCKILEVDSQAMDAIVAIHAVCGSILLSYCKIYVSRIAAARPPTHQFPNDLEVPMTDFADLVLSMDSEQQTLISHVALELTATWGWLGSHPLGNPGWLERLQDEVQDGKCTIVVNGDGVAERVASVVAFNIGQAAAENDDGDSFGHLWSSVTTESRPAFVRLFSRGPVASMFSLRAGSVFGVEGKQFVQLGRKDKNSSLVAACQLPGGKLRRSETTEAGIKRILEKKLAQLVVDVNNMPQEQRVKREQSTFHGVRTKYLITVCKATAKEPVNAPFIRLTGEDVRNLMCAVPFHLHWWQRGAPREAFGAMGDGLVVYRMNDDHRPAYYAWLRQEDCDYFRSATGEAVLVEILNLAHRELASVEPSERTGAANTGAASMDSAGADVGDGTRGAVAQSESSAAGADVGGGTHGAAGQAARHSSMTSEADNEYSL